MEARKYRIDPFVAENQMEMFASLVERLEALVDAVDKLRAAVIVQGGK